MQPDSSPLAEARRKYRPRAPRALERLASRTLRPDGPPLEVDGAVRERFPRTSGASLRRAADGGGPVTAPLRVGVVLSGGQAPGGHDVIAGLYEGLTELHAGSTLAGFLGGPRGLLDDRARDIDAAQVETFRHSGGFDWIGSGRDKIETDAQIAETVAVCRARELDGLVVIGGDDSNTNAAVLEEAFRAAGIDTRVVGVPKTIDGDLKGGPIETSFGFDTATKVYAELIGNVARDSRSAGKYWHFIKLMGRSASHVTLECALATHPNLAWIGEEVRAHAWTLAEIVERTAVVVAERAAAGKNYGICLVPEGLVEFIPEVGSLLGEINATLATADLDWDAMDPAVRADRVGKALGADAAKTFTAIPAAIRRQLVADRDSHGNVQVSLIQTERLLVEAVRDKLRKRGIADFKAHTHFFGYEGRCAFPSNFDAEYTWALGRLAALCIARDVGGVVAALQGLDRDAPDWTPAAVPLTSLLHMEMRKGERRPVIAKALVDLEGTPFAAFDAARERWRLDDAYRYPGPIQYFGDPELCDARTITLGLERGA